MSEVIFRNPFGIEMVKTDFVKRSQVKVVYVSDQGERHTIRTYRFNRIDKKFLSPYISWENLDCCGGWSFDEAYLDTAVQKGKKLYAGRTVIVDSKYFDGPTRKEATEQFVQFKKDLPANVFADVETNQKKSDSVLATFICKIGCLADYYDLDDVFSFQKLLGITISDTEKSEIIGLCHTPIKNYGTKSAPFIYFFSESRAELIVTGLLLGYPLESTASIIEEGY